MRFAQNEMFSWLWLVVLTAIFLFWAFKQKKSLMNRFAGALLPDIAQNFSFNRQIVKYILLILVIIFSTISLARPQWGFEWQEIKREGLDIIVAIDTSKSMLTDDVKPNRLEKTKLAVKDLLKKLNGDRIGLIAFAGDAFLVCPLTVDYSGFRLSLNDLSVNTIPRGGSAIAAAIYESIKGYNNISAKNKIVIIVTDGENLEGDPVAAAKEANDKGIKIFSIGIGTKEGELIRIQDENGNFNFLKDNKGNFIKSRLNENILEEIARETGGAYVHSSGAGFGIDLIYEKQLLRLGKREFESKMEKKYYERFQIPLLLGFILLITETLLGTRKKLIKNESN